MSKLNEAIENYSAARERVLSLNEELRRKHEETEACERRGRELGAETEVVARKLRNARSQLKDVAAQVGPLLHSDVAGICGGHKEDAALDDAIDSAAYRAGAVESVG